MADIELTLFNAKEHPDIPKVALSPYKDEEFIFVNKKAPDLKSSFMIMCNHFVLSEPLNIHKPTLLNRTIEGLAPYKYNIIKNIILDLDEICTKDDYLETIEYFKEKNHSCILGKSRSYNGIDNFNIKGILRVQFINDPVVIKKALTQIQVELGSRCKVDLHTGDIQSYQAPTHSKMIVHYNENGTKFTDKDVHITAINDLEPKHFDENTSNFKLEYNNEVIDECIKIFSSLGYMPIGLSESSAAGTAVNFRHPSEKKSPGGFYWYSDQPLVMHHHNKSRTISIFGLLKETEAGKEFLKNKTKKEQEYQLIKDNTSTYKKNIITNERYLNPDKYKDTINELLQSDKGIIKLKSPMGTAKSNIISSLIEEAHKRNLKVIVISNRVSVAEDFSEKYGVLLYKDKESLKEEQSLVVQFDSLHKYSPKKYDIVILDEFISLLFHNRSNLTSNTNINIVKYKILMETKKVLVADAFLTGYEDIFFKDREILSIQNEYRDDIKLYEYTNKDYFISEIIKKAKNLNGNKLSASFTSTSIMKVTYNLLLEEKIKVVMLSAETANHTRDLIYRRFKETNHNSYDVILYSPTLTVGVSNLNNIEHHFHYDSGMSTDVVSSLQMIKRSRKASSIHFFLEERQFYYDTSAESINTTAQKNISTFYNSKNSTLLIDIDYETGDLKLTELGKYTNKIEAFYNITKNNHANAFRILLKHQIKTEIVLITEEANINIRKIQKELKEQEKNLLNEALKEYDFDNKELVYIEDTVNELKNKDTELTKQEQIQILYGKVKDFCYKNKDFFGEITPGLITEIAEKELNTGKYLSTVKRYLTSIKALKSSDYSLFLLSKVIQEDLFITKKANYIKFLQYLILLRSNNITLKERYSLNQTKEIDCITNSKTGTFVKFLKSTGYTKGEAKYYLNLK